MAHISPARSVTLPAGFLDELLPELDQADVVGIALGGSYARGTATALSDVDLALFVREDAQVRPKRYFYHRGRLVSVATKSLAGVRADLTQPRQATRVVPGLAECRVLVDKDGALAALMRDLTAFTWASVQARADEYVSSAMMALAESVHKVANEWAKGNTPGVAYTSPGLLSALTDVALVYHGILVESDSTCYQQIYAAVGPESAWTACHRRAAGLTGAGLAERAQSCLALYPLTLDLVRPVMRDEHAQVAAEAARRVAPVYAGGEQAPG